MIDDIKAYKATKAREYTSAVADIANGWHEARAIAQEFEESRNHGRGNLAFFLREFLPEKFYRQFDGDMLHAITRIQEAIINHGTFAEAMPRGKGKTTVAEGAILWAASYGHRKFLLLIGNEQTKTNEVLANIQSIVEGECEKYCAAFPEVAYPVQRLEGRNQRCQAQHISGTPTNMTWRADKIVLPSVDGAASSGVIIQAKGLTAKGIRGLKDGSQRPDFVLLDDPQTDESAESKEQTDKRERIILGSVMGLAGHEKNISAVMACTVICKGDLSDRFLDHEKHPEWQGYITRLVDQWPTRADLWEKYEEIYRDDVQAGKGHGRATEFYRDNRADMDEGARVADSELYDKDQELSAVQHAYNLRLVVGESAFEAEYQNAPKDMIQSQYTLTNDMVCSHAVNLPPLVVPADTTVLVGHCDINRSDGGLHWCMAGFSQTMTGHTPAYGHYPDSGDLWPKNASKQVIQQSIFAGLKAVCDRIQLAVIVQDNRRITPNLLLIDAGFEGETVHRFCDWARRDGGYSFSVLPSIGRAAKSYRIKSAQLIGRPMEQAHIQRAINDKHKRYAMFNADYWREVSQRAFLVEPGAAGGFTLFKAAASYHGPFADHVIAEKLSNKYETPEGMRWEWTHQPGTIWDWGDALTGCWVAAALSGLTASGEPVQARTVLGRKRGVRHVKV